MLSERYRLKSWRMRGAFRQRYFLPRRRGSKPKSGQHEPPAFAVI